MLRHLRVRNFAILSDLALELGDGLNVFTGETGAGKSLIVEAVNLLRGGRASADIPREGADEAVVEAIFEVPDDLSPRVRAVLEEAGLPGADEEDGLLVRRVIHRGGRSRTYVNGALTTAGRLAELGRLLCDLSGQHQHQGLVDPKRHRAILDQVGGCGELCEAMAAAWKELCAAREALERLSGAEADRQDRIDYLRFQLDEIESAELRPDEEEELSREAERLRRAGDLMAGARAAELALYSGEGSATDRLDGASRELERLAGVDDELGAPLGQIGEARALAEEAAGALRRYAERLEADPTRLEDLEDRLALIRRLGRKHGGGLAEVLARRDTLREELDGLEHHEERLADLEEAVTRAERRAREAAGALSAARRKAARRLERDVRGALGDLGLGAARLRVALEAVELGPTGADRVELRLAANKGEKEKPLARVASGGELSRIMLALKLVLRRADGVATYVFDEVDAGIGGATAEVVGQKIRDVAEVRQVLCVTHLPQIAAFADAHYRVEKEEAGGRTETRVTSLGERERQKELARMLGGLEITRSAREHAREMLRRARA